MHTGEGWRLGRRPALDGLRGIAVLLVMGAHAVLLPNDAGAPGVAIFFALSGFLITALLLEEHARTGHIRFGAFYARRARRLLPALAVVLAFVAVIWPALGLGSRAREVFATMFYVANWHQLREEIVSGPLMHMWSLAVEEQFYLIWPAVLALAASRGRRWVIGACLVGISASVGIKGWLWATGASELRIWFGSDTRADGLFLGALVAAALVGRAHVPMQRSVLPAVLMGAVLWFAVVGDLPRPAGTFVVPAATAVLVWRIVTGSPLRPLEWGPLRWVGRRSYALYLWHMPVIALGGRSLGLGGWRSVLLLAITVAVAALSWRYVEEPFLRRRSVRAGEPAGLLGGATRVAAPTTGAEPVAARVEPARG